MKKLFAILLALVLLSCSVLCTSAQEETPISGTKTTIEYLENGDYIETVIEWEESTTRVTIPGTKTANYKNSSGTILWSLKVTGTFSYNGTTCTCTSARHTATSYVSYVTIKSASASRSGNKATAYGTATITLDGVTRDVSLSVTLSCSANGVLS